MVLTDPTTQKLWLMSENELASYLNKPLMDTVEYVEYMKQYWTALGFVRRNAANEFIEEESWGRPRP